MPTLYSLTDATALANLRLDLSDVSSTRWTDAALNRAIDKAIEKISEVYPLIGVTQIQTIKHVTRYPFPTGAGSTDSIEYPLDQWPPKLVNFEPYKTPTVTDPVTAPVAAQLSSAGSLSAGAYKWAYTFAVPGNHETLPSPLGSLSALAGKGIFLTGWPTPPEGVVGVNLYRTTAGGSQLKLLATLAGPPTELPLSYTDTLGDGSLGTNVPTSNDTGGWDAISLLLPPELTPPDSSSWMNISATYKHTITSTGTTIPERYWDALALGAQTYAVDAYLQVTNDNFEFADGMLRDKIDDTKSMEAWQTQAHSLWARWTQRLNQLKADWNAHRSGTVQWGDIALRSERL